MSAFANKVLLATDGSPDAERAARMAIALSNGLNLELHVVCVGHAPSVYTGSETEFLDPEFQNWLREGAKSDARAKLEELAERIKEMGGEVAKTHAAVGRPDAEIVHIAEELGAGLAIVGSRGLGPLERALMGSVSDSVVRHAHCPVLVVREKRHQDSAAQTNGEEREIWGGKDAPTKRRCDGAHRATMPDIYRRGLVGGESGRHGAAPNSRGVARSCT
jgi:nucleotide-binding universal stress UspA family protein